MRGGPSMNSNKKRILCIDDDREFLQFLRLLLQDAGYIVTEASSGSEGLVKFKTSNPDLVLIDLMMDQFYEGAKVCKEMRSLNDSVPILLVSTIADHFRATSDPKEFPFDAYLQKPVNEEALLKKVEERAG